LEARRQITRIYDAIGCAENPAARRLNQQANPSAGAAIAPAAMSR